MDRLSSLATELQLGIIHHLPRTSLLIICLLNNYWRGVGNVELMRRLFPIPPCKIDRNGIFPEKDLLNRAIRQYIDFNNADDLQRLLDFRPNHPYFRPPTTSLLLAEPAILRARVTKSEEDRFCLGSIWAFSSWAVRAAFRYNDVSCMQLLIDKRLTDYDELLDEAVQDGYWGGGSHPDCPARPIPALDSRGGHNSVLNWLLAYPPRHVVQAMLVMWGRLYLHPRLLPLCDWCDRSSRYDRRSCDNMLIVAAGRGHPASLQTIDELRMMVKILTDEASGDVIPEARQPLFNALRIARGTASMWPGTPPRVAEYLQNVCIWEYDHSSSSISSTNNTPPLPAPTLILPPQDPDLHRLIDLKTYDEMIERRNWLWLRSRWPGGQLLMWLMSTEFLADEEAARRMCCFQHSLRGLHSSPGFTYDLLQAGGAFRRWRCVEVVLGELRGMWPGCWKFFKKCPDLVLCRAVLDAVHGEPGCADGRMIRKLFLAGASNLEEFKGFGVDVDQPFDCTFRGGWFGWESFRLAFVERPQDCEQRETPACREVRDAVLDCMPIIDEDALDALVGEPAKALYRASTRRRQKRLADEREKAKKERLDEQLGGE